MGIRPEVALFAEYLSINKEQRLYMGWLRDLYQITIERNYSKNYDKVERITGESQHSTN
eukprot:CAMPEP_0168610728 /NCGR_PEP_ID=MMETSP0449_2-20121227/1949_1 /TAXON_ID=1082188 /ORGANISM="Strombidium rassoulzadegani, Strain ras09" /LENGTH=58 /DNA_ID=CAMNT_0008651067 /DNA_START=139 /DNA_END=315 /DNA_ORIENTATION=-